VGVTPLTIQVLEGRAGLRLTGEADLASRDILEKALEGVLGRDGDVHIELGELAFIDAGGVALFVNAGARMTGGHRLVLHRPSYSLRRIIELLWGQPPGIEMDLS
jgi:anti-anti-sigma factor